jgi:transcription elongation factor GreA
METVYLTREGLEKLRLNLEQLLKVDRPEATNQLATARAHGDLSENAEYDAAREKLAGIDRRIAEMSQNLNRVQLIDQDTMSGKEVRILSRVTLSNLDNKAKIEYTLVDPLQSDPSKRLISVKSPIGLGLLGKKVGEEVVINVPSGQFRFMVESIDRSEGL